MLCVLSAGGELSSMLPTGKLIGEMVKDACKEPRYTEGMETDCLLYTHLIQVPAMNVDSFGCDQE